MTVSIPAHRCSVFTRNFCFRVSALLFFAFTGLAFTAPSAAAKAGIVAMTRSLAVEWGPKGIRLNAVAPGHFPTEGAWERLYPPGSQVEPQELGVPLRRLGQHIELANLFA